MHIANTGFATLSSKIEGQPVADRNATLSTGTTSRCCINRSCECSSLTVSYPVTHAIQQSLLAQTWGNCDCFVLVGAMNPCPCGYYGDEHHECTCSMGMVQRYQKRISGPLLDRIDIHLDVRSVPYQKLSSLDSGEPSSAIRCR